MMHFNKENKEVLFLDRRCIEKSQYERNWDCKPDVLLSFTNMHLLPDEHFRVVIFDPPHFTTKGDANAGSWCNEKYGQMINWREGLQLGFTECWRVLQKGGLLIFKWFDADRTLSEVLPFAPCLPLVGTRSPNAKSGTHWLHFFKPLG